MFMRKRKLGSLGCAVLSLILLLAMQARAADVENSVEGNATENDSGFYFDVGASAYVVELPEWTPLWFSKMHFPGPTFSTTGRMKVINKGFVGGQLYEATLGKELVDQWFVETRLEYAVVDDETYQYEHGNGTSEGPTWFPLDGVSTNLRGGVNEIDIKTELTFRQYGVDLVAGKTYGGDDWHIRPFAGYWFQETDTTYHLLWETGNVVMHYKENLRTTYNGLLAGVELTFPINGGEIGLETTHGVALANTRYDGYWKDMTSQNSMKLNKNEPAYQGTLQFSASSHEVHGWKLGLTGELRYLSYVPRIIASGQASNANFGTGPTHLVGDSSFSGKLGINLGYSF